MIKRIPASLFILFASIVLLANAVIAHHHHKSEVCIERTHCESDGKGHQDGATENNHEHDGTNNFEICALQQIFVIPSTLREQELKSIDILFHYHDFNKIMAILPGTEAKIIITSHYLDAPPVFPFYSFYLHFTSPTRGFRAPPLV